MNKFYYFSKSKLEFVEIKNLPKKFFILVAISSISICTLLTGGFYFVKSLSKPVSEVESLRLENKELTEKYKELFEQYKNLNTGLDTLLKSSDDLRTVADLPPLSQDEKTLGTGGSAYEAVIKNIKSNSKIDIDQIENYIESIKSKFEFEKKNYFDVSSKLKENKKLFASLPAIKPTEGTFASHGFGMRMHPILGIMRMHEGVDIMTNIGTPVVASGGGTVDFVGYKGGLGLCVEIDHGFGYRTVYGHLSANTVTMGQKVNRGQLIAKTGNTGLSSGPHLHYEVQHNGEKENPMDFIFDDFGVFEPTLKN